MCFLLGTYKLIEFIYLFICNLNQQSEFTVYKSFRKDRAMDNVQNCDSCISLYMLDFYVFTRKERCIVSLQLRFVRLLTSSNLRNLLATVLVHQPKVAFVSPTCW
jgi:hypothetical protein